MYKGLVSVNGSDKLGLLWFCKTCLANIRGYISSSSAGPLTQTNEDSPKGLSQRSPNSEILNSKQGNSNSIKSNPSISKNDKQEWKTVNNSLKQPEGAGNTQIVETKNKYSILGGLEDSVNCELTLVGDSIIREQLDIFCNRGRKICNRLCIPGGNIKNISDVVSKLGNSRRHIVTRVSLLPQLLQIWPTFFLVVRYHEKVMYANFYAFSCIFSTPSPGLKFVQCTLKTVKLKFVVSQAIIGLLYIKMMV